MQLDIVTPQTEIVGWDGAIPKCQGEAQPINVEANRSFDITGSGRHRELSWESKLHLKQLGNRSPIRQRDWSASGVGQLQFVINSQEFVDCRQEIMGIEGA